MSKPVNKILIVSPSFHVGGIERSLSTFANFFAEKNIEVLFVSCMDGEVFFPLHDKVKIAKPSFFRPAHLIGQILYRLRIVAYIRANIRRFRPDVVFSMSDTFNPVSLIANFGLKTRIFVGDVTRPDKKFDLITRLGKQYLYPTSTGFIAQTNWAAEYYKKKFKHRLNIKVIYGAVLPVKRVNTPKRNLIINVGRINHDKGQDRMIEIFSLVKNRSDWKLAFTADGPLKPKLVELIKEKGLESNIQFLGRVDDLDRLYCEASIFVLPSRIEGFPNALCEAMSAGLPCISFDSFPVGEIITDGKDGFVVRDGDYETFAEKIEKLISDPELRSELGKEATYIVDRLNIGVIGGQVLDFFRHG